MKAEDAITPFGFTDMLENLVPIRVCEQHNRELKLFCNDDKKELCDLCWADTHKKHDVELIEILENALFTQLSSPWERRMLMVSSIILARHIEKETFGFIAEESIPNLLVTVVSKPW